MSSLLRLVALLATARVVIASCAHGTSLFPRAEGEAVPIGKFGYTGLQSPINWFLLDPAANSLCATGTRQSPIDMTNGQFTLVPGNSIQLNIPDIAETEFENLGTTVEVIVPPGATMVSNGVQFELKQFHFHLPSEHLDEGQSVAMEMHMVWESAAQQIAVIGVYLNTANQAAAPVAVAEPLVAKERRHAKDTKRDPAVVSVIQGGGIDSLARSRSTLASQIIDLITGNSGGLSSSGGLSQLSVGVQATGGTSLIDTIMANVGRIATPGTRTKIGPLRMSDLVDSIKAGNFQAYSGSLTTPPCSEGVSWMVSTAKQTISLGSFEAARNVIGFNSRFPQNTLGQPNLLSVAASAGPGAVAAAPAAAAPVAAAPVAPISVAPVASIAEAPVAPIGVAPIAPIGEAAVAPAPGPAPEDTVSAEEFAAQEGR